MIDLLFTSIELGLLYSLVALGVYLTFRILRFPDLTIDGSFVTGAAATAVAIHGGVPGVLAMFIGFLAGFLAGSLTAFLHTRLGISKILSGILSLSMLYTVNLRIMSGPNISLLNERNIIGWLKTPLNDIFVICFFSTVILAVKFFIDWFLQTEIGLRLRATGDNEVTAQSFAINTNTTKFIGIALSNGFAGLSGGLIAQYQGFADVGMGIGIIILGFAALMLGEIFTSSQKIPIITMTIIVGAILYQLIINIALRLGLPGSDLKFITAFIVLIALIVSREKYLVYGR